MKYYVEIVKYGEPEEIVERMGPMSEGKADRVCGGASININYQEYYTRIIEEEVTNV